LDGTSAFENGWTANLGEGRHGWNKAEIEDSNFLRGDRDGSYIESASYIVLEESMAVVQATGALVGWRRRKPLEVDFGRKKNRLVALKCRCTEFASFSGYYTINKQRKREYLFIYETN